MKIKKLMPEQVEAIASKIKKQHNSDNRNHCPIEELQDYIDGAVASEEIKATILELGDEARAAGKENFELPIEFVIEHINNSCVSQKQKLHVAIFVGRQVDDWVAQACMSPEERVFNQLMQQLHG